MRVWRLLFSFVAVVCAAGVAGQNDSNSIDDILNTPSSLHGRVEKKGGLDPVVWDALWHSNRNEFMTWVRQSARERPQEPPAPYQCQLFINHKYNSTRPSWIRYIYVRHPKTGSSSIFIRKLGGRCGKDTNKPTCMVQLQHGTDPDKARQWWNEYLVFTFVRNPWSRAASGLQFLSAINHSKDPSCTTTFQRFCQDPNAFGRLCRSNDSCCKFGPMFDWLHLQGQAQCMFTADGLPAVDFIGRSENSEEDFQDLVAMINDRLPPGLPRVQGGELGHENSGLSWVAKAEGTDLTKARRKYKNRYSEEYTSHPECIEALRRVYRKDVEWLGYSNSTGADLAH